MGMSSKICFIAESGQANRRELRFATAVLPRAASALGRISVCDADIDLHGIMV